jgi:hypothetical protein
MMAAIVAPADQPAKERRQPGRGGRLEKRSGS